LSGETILSLHDVICPSTQLLPLALAKIGWAVPLECDVEM